MSSSPRTPKSAKARFVLAYHYMVQGHGDAAADQFRDVVALQPKDALAAQFAKVLSPPEVPRPAEVAPSLSSPRRLRSRKPRPRRRPSWSVPGRPARRRT